MESLNALFSLGFATALTPANLLWALLGCTLGTAIGVAGAAKGELGLVTFGILISIPIIVWGSQFVLKLMDRFPVVITLGAALLGWIAGDMVLGDVMVKPYLTDAPHWLHYVSAAAGAVFVVVVGKLLAKRTEAAVPVNEIALGEMPRGGNH